jgi:hypothetical protein
VGVGVGPKLARSRAGNAPHRGATSTARAPHRSPLRPVRMRYVLFRAKGAAADAALNVGVMVGGDAVADVTAALADAGTPAVHSMRVFLEMGARGADTARGAAADVKYRRALADVDLRAPIYDP